MKENIPDWQPLRKPLETNEQKLVKIQAVSDEIGKELYQEVRRGVFDSANLAEMNALKNGANLILSSLRNGRADQKLHARLFYNEDRFHQRLNLVLPTNHNHDSAAIEGRLNGVEMVVAEFPAPEHNGEEGFRLLEKIIAVEALGLRALENSSRIIFVPVGELDFSPVTSSGDYAVATQKQRAHQERLIAHPRLSL